MFANQLKKFFSVVCFDIFINKGFDIMIFLPRYFFVVLVCFLLHAGQVHLYPLLCNASL